jgi:hypothetical protein
MKTLVGDSAIQTTNSYSVTGFETSEVCVM